MEVKCPFSSRDKEILSVTVPYLRSTEDGLSLDHSHDYYYQIQGQMFCSGHQSCKLVIFTQKDFKVIKIKFDQTFVDSMVQKLVNFFTDYHRTAVINYHFHHDYDTHFSM